MNLNKVLEKLHIKVKLNKIIFNHNKLKILRLKIHIILNKMDNGNLK